MLFRVLMLLAAAGLTAAGITASAYSLSHGQTDQAIAFAWPAIAAIIAFGLIMPSQRAAHSGPDPK